MKKKVEVKVEVVEEIKCKHVSPTGLCHNMDCAMCNLRCPGPQAKCFEQEGVTQPTVPTTLAVRQHKHLVNLSTADALNRQYERVDRSYKGYLKEMVIFGAMMQTIDNALSNQRYSSHGNGVSIRSWMEENCPNIPYFTAMSYKRTAINFVEYMKMHHQLEITEEVPLVEMLSSKDPYEEQAKEELRRQLLAPFATLTKNELNREVETKRGRQGGALKGTHGKAAGRQALTVEDRAAMAAGAMRELCGSLRAFIFDGDALALMTTDELSEFAGELGTFAAKVKDVIWEKTK